MNRPIVIFGTGKIAEVISYYAMHECGFQVEAFVVDKEHKQFDTFQNKPVITVDQLTNLYPPAQYDMFVALGYQNLNVLRASKVHAAKALGYKLISVVSPRSGLAENIKYGENCFIMPPCIIHPCVQLGNNVFVWSGAMIGHHSVIADHCWFTSNCNIGGNVVMGSGCFVAMNATVSHSVQIGRDCFLGANTLVTKNMEDEKVVIAESSKPIKLNSKQFLKFSSFSTL